MITFKYSLIASLLLIPHWQLVVYVYITPSKYVKLIIHLMYWLSESLLNTYSVSGAAEDIRDKMMNLLQRTDRLLGET